MHGPSRLPLQRVGPGQTWPSRLTHLLLRPCEANWDPSHVYMPGSGLVPKGAVGGTMHRGLSGPSPEDKSNSGQEDKQVIRAIWLIWLSQVVIARQFGVLTLSHLSFYVLILALIFSYLQK